MRLVLLGDGESPHLLKWARALAPRVELWAASSRDFMPGFETIVPADRRLALNTRPRFEGGNIAVLRSLPRLAAWLRRVQPDWIHAHYLTSHGTLAWLATRLLAAPGRIVASAWGSDILVAAQRSAVLRGLTRRLLRASVLATSDSQHMAERMRELGAHEVMTFPLGLDELPPLPAAKSDHLFYANRGLEPPYAPQRVIDCFAAITRHWPDARLVVANDGSQLDALRAQARRLGLDGRIDFVGRLDAQAQAPRYAQARWYVSLPTTDSVSVSVLEAMAHGCIPLLSDLPANRELVDDGRNGLIVADAALPAIDALQRLLDQGDRISAELRKWIGEHALFGPSVERFVARLQQLQTAPGRR